MPDEVVQDAGNSVLQWGSLGQAAAAGQLQLGDGVAERCAQHCSQFIDKLVQLKEQATTLSVRGSLGTLPSGIAVAEKLSLLAEGGEYSLVQALTDHIAVVTEMQAMFQQIGANYVATEEATTAAVGNIDPQV
ncbi:hypothetical protein [Rhodococcus gannanensis]|uniref:PE family protein n=1 Tax=Rhodococcus gannanensis TaxID=1960308 RepID=A0ABW4NZX9_9NOCA